MTSPNPSEHELLWKLFDVLPTGVMVADDAANYVAVNRAACELIGRPREQVLGAHVSDLVAPGRHAEVNLQWQAFLRDGEQSGIFSVDLPNGGRRSLRFHARANFVPGRHCSFLSPVSAGEVAPLGTEQERQALVVLCSWTKQIQWNGEWIAIERYLAERHDELVSHGMSPAAFERFAAHDED